MPGFVFSSCCNLAIFALWGFGIVEGLCGVLRSVESCQLHLGGSVGFFPLQGLFLCPVEDEGLLHELLVLKRVQFLFILALRV